MAANANATQVAYYFLTHWKKCRALPHLRLTHEIPKIDNHNITAINLYKKLEDLIKDIEKIREKRLKEISENQELREELEKQTTELKPYNAKLKGLEENRSSPILQDLIDQNNLLRVECEGKIKNLRQRRKMSQDKLKKSKEEIASLKDEIKKPEKEKRDLAITILTR